MEHLQATACILEIPNWLNYEYATVLKEEMAGFSTIIIEKRHC